MSSVSVTLVCVFITAFKRSSITLLTVVILWIFFFFQWLQQLFLKQRWRGHSSGSGCGCHCSSDHRGISAGSGGTGNQPGTGKKQQVSSLSTGILVYFHPSVLSKCLNLLNQVKRHLTRWPSLWRGYHWKELKRIESYLISFNLICFNCHTSLRGARIKNFNSDNTWETTAPDHETGDL